MMRLHFLLLLTCCTVSWSFSQEHQQLALLAETIQQTRSYDSIKTTAIGILNQSLSAKNGNATNEQTFDRYARLYEAYKVYNYDSAFKYVLLLSKTGRRIGTNDYIIPAKLKMSFILLSAGLYRETYDTLRSISIADCLPKDMAEYYTLMARYYYDLSAYVANNHFSNGYNKQGNIFMDSALHYYTPQSFEHDYYTGLRYYKSGFTDSALRFFDKAVKKTGLDEHQTAIAASTLGSIYEQRGREDEAIDLLIKASIADIKNSTKETFAIFNLAQLLYKKGDVKYASICIETAIANAVFYDARQRKVQVSSILPVIENEKLSAIERQRKYLIQYGILATLFLVILGVLIVVIRRQVKKLKAAQKTISEAHTAQREINTKLEEVIIKLEHTNKQLEEVNMKLEESNKIKEEYIGQFFNVESELFNRLERLKATLDAKITDRKWDEMRFVVNNNNLKSEKEELLHSFDKIFLKIYPNFLPVFNQFFNKEDQLVLDNEMLPTDLRIFALMRMGITDNEKIARILGYSVNTIYTYKAKIKNKSILSKDDFDKRLMEIKSA